MADTKCKADKPLHSNKEQTHVHQQLINISNDLSELVCIARFYHNAVHAIALINNTEDLPLDEQGQYGMFAIGEWLHDKGDALIEQLHQVTEDKKRL